VEVWRGVTVTVGVRVGVYVLVGVLVIVGVLVRVCARKGTAQRSGCQIKYELGEDRCPLPSSYFICIYNH